MARLRWAGPARSDLARIEDFYATLDPEFAIRAIDSALEAAEFLLDRPRAGPTFTDGALRKWRVPATPLLLIIYQIETGSEAHTSEIQLLIRTSSPVFCLK